MTLSRLESALRATIALPMPSEIEIWSEEQYLLQRSLARQVPLFTYRQAKRFYQFSNHSIRVARVQLEGLMNAGLIERRSCAVPLPIVADSPTACWATGDPMPNLSLLHQKAYEHRREASPTNVWFYIASRETANRFGGLYRGVAAIDDIPQFIAWGEVYLRLLSEFPRLAQAIDASTIPAVGQPRSRLLPHLCVRVQRQTIAIIALAGFSSVAALERLHAHCESHSIPYFLW